MSAATEGCAVANTSLIGVLLGDVNQDGNVDLLDVAPFVALVSNSKFQAEADINQASNFDFT